jgi:hypothetical protein
MDRVERLSLPAMTDRCLLEAPVEIVSKTLTRPNDARFMVNKALKYRR